MLALCAVLLVSASGCNVFEAKHFGVSPSAWTATSWYIRIFQKPSAQVVAYNDWPVSNGLYCNGDEVCTLRFLRTQLDVHWLVLAATDVDFFFDDSQAGDIEGAINAVRGTNKCLMMNRNLDPVGDRHNWTQASAGGDCKVGELVTAG